MFAWLFSCPAPELSPSPWGGARTILQHTSTLPVGPGHRTSTEWPESVMLRDWCVNCSLQLPAKFVCLKMRHPIIWWFISITINNHVLRKSLVLMYPPNSQKLKLMTKVYLDTKAQGIRSIKPEVVSAEKIEKMFQTDVNNYRLRESSEGSPWKWSIDINRMVFSIFSHFEMAICWAPAATVHFGGFTDALHKTPGIPLKHRTKLRRQLGLGDITGAWMSNMAGIFAGCFTWV